MIHEKSKLLIILLVLVSKFSMAQPNIQKANKMAEKFPESDVYITQNNIDFLIGYKNREKSVIAIQIEKTELISLNSNVNKIFIENYNTNFSSIEKVNFDYLAPCRASKYNKDLNSYSIFHDDEKQKIIDLYFHSKGDFISINTKKRIIDLKYIDPIYLTNQDPTEAKKVTISIENELEFEILEFNFEKFKISKEYYFDEEKNKHKYEYRIENPPYVEDVNQLRGLSHYFPHILILPKKYYSKRHSQEYFKDVKDLYKWYSELVDSVDNDDELLKPLLRNLINENDSDVEKIKKIYYWVQQNIRYIAFEDGIAGFKPEAAQNVLNNKYGDCKGISNLTKHLLQLEGFDARLAWLGTNNRVYDYSVPSLIVDNHMICVLFFNDSVYYIDGTERFLPLGINAEKIQNKEILIEDGDNFIIFKVPAQKAKNNLKTRLINGIIDGKTIFGKSEMRYMGESKARIKSYISTIENDKKIKALKYYFETENIEIKNIDFSPIKSIDSIFRISFDFIANNAVMAFGDELYIKFENYFDYQNEVVDSSFLFDLDLEYKSELESRTSIIIPKNYSVSFVPENLSYSNKDFHIEVNFQIKNNELIYEKKIKILEGLIHNPNIWEWNEAINKLKEIYHSNIILKKV